MEYYNRITRALSGEESRGLEGCDSRQCLESRHGQVWDSFTLARDFDVQAFSGCHVVAVRREDGRLGTLIYQPDPRFYWGFTPS